MSGEAIVAKIDKVEPIPGADRIQVGYVLGERVIISKDVVPGTVGIYFPAETQLSHQYCHANNLYRHSDKNNDATKKGFFEDNRKVKAMKFLKVKSEGYFADLDSIGWFGFGKIPFQVGDRFTEYEGHEICRKFISEHTRNAIAKQKKIKHIETPLFKQHVDTEQFKYFVDKIPVGATLSFHAKLHGTSARYSHTLVRRTPKTFLEKIAKRLFGTFKGEESWEYIAGTRRVVLYEDDHEKIGFNGPESWRLEWLEKLKPYLDRGVTVYGEIVGYANGSPIMAKHDVTKLGDKRYEEKYGKEITYKYGCPEGTNRFIIYRVTYTTIDGNEIDLSVDQLKHWCETRGLECTREVEPRLVLGNKDSYDVLKDYVQSLTDEEPNLDEDWYDPSHIREGIVIRVDYKDATPTFYKNKCYNFKVMEGIANETTVDLEDAS